MIVIIHSLGSGTLINANIKWNLLYRTPEVYAMVKNQQLYHVFHLARSHSTKLVRHAVLSNQIVFQYVIIIPFRRMKYSDSSLMYLILHCLSSICCMDWFSDRFSLLISVFFLHASIKTGYAPLRYKIINTHIKMVFTSKTSVCLRWSGRDGRLIVCYWTLIKRKKT